MTWFSFIRTLALLPSAVLAIASFARAAAPPLNIAAEHPRIFFTQADVERFRTQLHGAYAPKPGNSARSVIRENAFTYVIAGDKPAAAKAIAAAVKLCTPEVSQSPQ